MDKKTRSSVFPKTFSFFSKSYLKKKSFLKRGFSKVKDLRSRIKFLMKKKLLYIYLYPNYLDLNLLFIQWAPSPIVTQKNIEYFVTRNKYLFRDISDQGDGVMD